VEELDDFGVHADMTHSNYVFVPRAEVSTFRRKSGAAERSVGAGTAPLPETLIPGALPALR
jgi:hypothetical protein